MNDHDTRADEKTYKGQEPVGPTEGIHDSLRGAGIGLGGAMPQTSPDPSAKPYTGDEQPATPWPHTRGAESNGSAGIATSSMSIDNVVEVFTPAYSRARKELAHLYADRRMLATHAETIGRVGPEGIRGAFRNVLDNSRLGTLEKLNVLVDIIASLTPVPLLSMDEVEKMDVPGRLLPAGMKEQSLVEFLAHMLPAESGPRRKYRLMIEEIERLRLELRATREIAHVAGSILTNRLR